MMSPSSLRRHDAVFKTSPGKSWLMRDYESRLSMLRNAVNKTGKSLETPRKLPNQENQGTPKVSMQTAMLNLADALSGQDVTSSNQSCNGKSIDENMNDCVSKLQEALAVLRAPLTPRSCSPLGKSRTPLSRKKASTPMSRCNLQSLLERVSASPQSPHRFSSPINKHPDPTGGLSPLADSSFRVNKRLDLSPALEDGAFSKGGSVHKQMKSKTHETSPVRCVIDENECINSINNMVDDRNNNSSGSKKLLACDHVSGGGENQANNGESPKSQSLTHHATSVTAESLLHMSQVSDTDKTVKEEEMPAKYANMVKMGVPLAAVKIKMMADGVCVVEEVVSSQTARRQRLAWQAVDGGRRRNSIWHQDSPLTSPSSSDTGPNMVVLSPDALDDFEKHWTKRADVVPKKKKTVGSKKVKEVCVIDSKKSMNASIALARLMRAHGGVNVAHDVYCLRDECFSQENLLSMLEYAPTKLETVKLTHFIAIKKKAINKKHKFSPAKLDSSGGGGGMANVFAQLQQKNNSSNSSSGGGGMTNVFAQLQQKNNSSGGGGGGGGGMANVFAQLQQKNASDSGDQVQSLSKNSRSQKEQSLAMGELSSLSPFLECLSEGEKFMCFVMHVPQYESRVSVLSFKRGFADRIQVVKADTKTLTTACAAIKRSEKLKKLLKTVLELGNKVNEAEGKDNQAATAITVESLLALSTIKSFQDKKTTMMQYLVSFLMQTKPALLDFFGDFEESVLAASRVDLKCLAVEVKNLRSEALMAEKFRQETTEEASLVVEFDQCHQQLEVFLDGANGCIKRAQGEVDIAQAQFKALLDYFLEPDPDMDPRRFFATLLKFTKEFKDAKTAVEKAHQQKASMNRRLSLKKTVTTHPT